MAASTTSTTTTNRNDDGDSEEKQDDDRTKKQYKIAIVGAGAVGSYYGARLWEAGHDVQFYTRSKPTLPQPKRRRSGISGGTKLVEDDDDDEHHGLQVTSIDGNLRIPSSQWHIYDDVSQMQSADWIVVTLKSSALHVIPDLVIPLLQNDGSSRILVIMNGLIEDDLIQMLQEKTKQEIDPNNKNNQVLSCCQALYGGMALICSNRLSPTQISHTYAGLLAAGVATSNSNSKEEDEEAFRHLFQGSKVPITYEPNLLRGRWKKMVWNLPFNGISVAMGGITVDEIVTHAGLRQLAVAIMDETIATANAELTHVFGAANDQDSAWIPLGEAEKKQMMDLSDNMGPYKTSTMLDLTHRRSMEVHYLFREPITRADKLGIPVPQLRTVVAMIEAYQSKYNL